MIDEKIRQKLRDKIKQESNTPKNLVAKKKFLERGSYCISPNILSMLAQKKIINVVQWKMIDVIMNCKKACTKTMLERNLKTNNQVITKYLNKLIALNFVMVDEFPGEYTTYYINNDITIFDDAYYNLSAQKTQEFVEIKQTKKPNQVENITAKSMEYKKIIKEQKDGQIVSNTFNSSNNAQKIGG